MNGRLKEGIRILSAAAFVFTVGGCDTVQPTQSPNPNPTASTSPFEGPLPSQTAYETQITETAPPRPVGFVTEADGNIRWYGKDGDSSIVPKIPGLTAEIKYQTLVYIASKGNSYGLNVDNETVVAEYKPYVMAAGTRVGGVEVAGPIAEYVMKNEPGTFPIPVAPSGPLTIIPSKLHFSTADYDGLTFTWEGEALAENPFPDNQGVYCSVQSPWDLKAWSFFANGEFPAGSTTSTANNLYFYGPTPAEITTDIVTKPKTAVGTPVMIIKSPASVIRVTTLNPQTVGIENISTVGNPDNPTPILLFPSTP